MQISKEIRYGAVVLLLALLGATLFVSFDDAPGSAPTLGELASYLTTFAESGEDGYKFRDDFQWLSNTTNTTTGENVTESGNQTVSGNQSFVGSNVSYEGNFDYDSSVTFSDSRVAITSPTTFTSVAGTGIMYFFSSVLNVLNELIALIDMTFQSSTSFVTAYFETAFNTIWESSDLTLTNGRYRQRGNGGKSTSWSNCRVFRSSSTDSSEFGSDGTGSVSYSSTQFTLISMVMGFAQSIFRVTDVSGSGFNVANVCGANLGSGDVVATSGAVLQVDETNCSTSNVTWSDSGTIGTSMSAAVGRWYGQSGSYLQLLAITSASLPLYMDGWSEFNNAFELDTDAPGALASRNVLIMKKDNSSQSCPSTACTVSDCPSSYSCACSWSSTSATTNDYCIASYAQTAADSDDSNQGLWALFALFALPLVCCVGLAIMKMCAPKAPPPVPIAKEPEYPTYPLVENYTVYPTAVAEYPEYDLAPVPSPMTPGYM